MALRLGRIRQNKLYSSLNLNVISYVLLPQAFEPCLNFNVPKNGPLSLHLSLIVIEIKANINNNISMNQTQYIQLTKALHLTFKEACFQVVTLSSFHYP